MSLLRLTRPICGLQFDLKVGSRSGLRLKGRRRYCDDDVYVAIQVMWGVNWTLRLCFPEV